MKLLRISYWGIWGLVALWAVLHETGLLPGGYLKPGDELNYALNLLCIVFSVGGAWLACRLFTFGRVKRCMALSARNAVRANAARLGVTALSILPGAFLYYAAENSSSILCCTLIGLTASLFCKPAVPDSPSSSTSRP